MAVLDLRYLDFDCRVTSGSPGIVPKAFVDGRFYKASNFNETTGFYGFSAMNDVIATQYLAAVGFHPLLYVGAEAAICVKGKEYVTYVNWSLDYRHGRPDVAFDDYIKAKGADRLSEFRRLDATYLDTMLAADFLVGNRDRHGANIRWLGDGFAPLFDFNLSLFMPDGSSRMQDILANNYIGGPSLLDNLELITTMPETHEPAWELVFSGCDYLYKDELKMWLDWRRKLYEEIRCCHA